MKTSVLVRLWIGTLDFIHPHIRLLLLSTI